MLRFRPGICLSVVVIYLHACEASKRDKVLMVSFDGFRWDFPTIFNTPNFNKLKAAGVSTVNGVKPVFVSNTFPNHFSIVTGVYPESHGIVDNNMFDTKTNQTFSTSKASQKEWWQEGTPIWMTAQEQSLKTGVYFWVGSEAEIRGKRPDIYRKYDKSVPYEKRVDSVVEWLKKDTVDLALLYFEEPDHTGHGFGIASKEFRSMVKKVDETLGYLLEKLETSKLSNRVNLLVVSDHGMVNFTQDMINLENYVNVTWLRRVVPSVGATVGIFPDSRVPPEMIYDQLKNVSKNMKVYLKKDLPHSFGYKNHHRIAPVIAVADEGFLVSRVKSTSKLIGYHGFSNDLLSMRPIFLARGPAFKKNHTAPNFSSLDIYPLLCHLLQIKPAPNNGSLEAVKPLLETNRGTTITFSIIVSVIGLLITYLNY